MNMTEDKPVFTEEGEKLVAILEDLLKEAKEIVDGDTLLSMIEEVSAY